MIVDHGLLLVTTKANHTTHHADIIHTTAYYAAKNGHLFTELNILLLLKPPSLVHITPRYTHCVNAPLGK